MYRRQIAAFASASSSIIELCAAAAVCHKPARDAMADMVATSQKKENTECKCGAAVTYEAYPCGCRVVRSGLQGDLGSCWGVLRSCWDGVGTVSGRRRDSVGAVLAKCWAAQRRALALGV